MRLGAILSASAVAGLLACQEAAGPDSFSLILQETRLPTSVALSAALGDTVAYLVLHDTSAAPDTVSYGQVRGCINANGIPVELVAGVRDVIHAWTATGDRGARGRQTL